MPTIAEPGQTEVVGPAADIIRTLTEDLRSCLVPLAKPLQCSIAVASGTGVEWLATDALCRCTTGAFPRGGFGSCGCGRSGEAIPIIYEGTRVGNCWICLPSTMPSARGAVSKIIDSELQRISLARQEALLLTELSSCWESLEALYDIHALPPPCRSVETIVEWILARVVEGEDPLQAEFWLEVEGRLVPRAARSVGPRPPMPGLSEMVSRSLTEQLWIVIDETQELIQTDAIPADWDPTVRLLIAPAVSRHGTRGALVVWGKKGKRPFDSRLLRHAQALATQAVMAVEGDRLSSAALENEIVQHDMEIGSELQRILLLGDEPSEIGFAKVASLAIPSQKLGGDFLEFFHLSADHLDILVGDVMGKGLRASLVGAAITRQFHRTLCSLMTADTNCHAAPETIVSSVHEGVARRLAEFDSFVTLNYARVDAIRNRLDYVDCGHPPIMHFHKRTGHCDALYGKNVPLGFSDFEVYEQVSAPYEHDDVFVIYSDGLIELRNDSGELFGLDRLIAVIEAEAGLQSPDGVTAAIQKALYDFTGHERTDDDLTIVVVRVNCLKKPSALPGPKSLEFSSDLEHLEDCRSFVRAICHNEGAPILEDDEIGLLELAVTEVASNIIIHAQEGKPDRRFRIEGKILDDSVRVRFDYAGRAFDPTVTPDPTFDGTRENGFGVYLTSQCVDQVSYNCTNDGLNFIVMIKNRTQTS